MHLKDLKNGGAVLLHAVPAAGAAAATAEQRGIALLELVIVQN